MNASERARAQAERRRAIESARTASIASLWQLWAVDMQAEAMQPALRDKLRAAFYEGAWRVAENVATVAVDVRQRLIADMAEALIAEAWRFDETDEARRAFEPEGDA